jgi:hypothetical protein
VDWTIQDLGSLGEFVASIAVVITLLFLTVQVRLSRQATDMNTKVTRAAAAAQSQDHLTTINELIASDASLSKLIENALAQGSFEGFAPDEVFRVHIALRANMQHFESMFFQFEVGLLEPRLWALRRSWIGSFIGTPPISDWWSAERESSVFTEEFISDVESAEGFTMGPLSQRASSE